MSSVFDFYKYLHTIPELGHQEFKTAAFLADRLEKYGFQVTRNIGGSTGIVGIYDSKQPGPTLALRADMDALGSMVDGVVAANHTCGHDAHSSMVLAAAKNLLETNAIQKGKLKILFQPAEELATGALSMIKAGVIDDVDIILGQHLRPCQETPMGKAAGAVYYSASTRIIAKITGLTAHGARPHLGINAIDAATAAITAVNAIHLDPALSYSAKATRFLCDTSVTNVIPNEATVTWDVRAEKNSTMKHLCEFVEKAILAGAATVGATASVAIVNPIPAAEFDQTIVDVLKKSIIATLGENGLQPDIFTPGGEDFNFFKQYKPTIKAGFIGLGCDLKPGLHHPAMHFNLDALPTGVAILVHATKQLLG